MKISGKDAVNILGKVSSIVEIHKKIIQTNFGHISLLMVVGLHFRSTPKLRLDWLLRL